MRRTILILLIILTAHLAKAQDLNMTDVLKTTPDSLLPLLSANNRLDFIDFAASHMEAKVTNQLGGQSVMTKLTDRYLHIRMSNASEVQMRLLPLFSPVDSMSQMICLVHTYGTPDIGQESIVTFYSCSWRRLPLSVRELISPQELLHRPTTMSQERFAEIGEMMKPSFIVAQLSDVTDKLTFSLSPATIPEEDFADIEAARVLMKFNWNEKEWIKCE